MLLRHRLIFVIGLFVFLVCATQTQANIHATELSSSQRQPSPLYFIENQGQLDPQVKYYLQTQDKTLYFTSTGVTTALTKVGTTVDTVERWVVKLDFVEGRAEPTGQNRMETVVSYFRGSSEQWQTGLPTYTQLVYANLWPGIDLIYTIEDNQLKYHFNIQPGTNPAHIRLAYHGASNVQLTPTGQLKISTPLGSFHDAAPHAYQPIQGEHAPVEVAYSLANPSAAADTYEYSFRLGPYDPTRLLVLDPAIILYAGFIGGSQREDGSDIAVDANGYAYITGRTHSTIDFPAAVGPDLSHNGGPYNGDAFIAKVKADGTGLVYAGFIGGSGEDYGYGVAVDSSGQAYVTGDTSSTDFPTTPGAYDRIYNGGGDAFVVKVRADGRGLVYATYIGDVVSPTTNDTGEDIAVDANKNAYVLIDSSFGPYGGYDTSVAKLNATGSALSGLQYIGGNDNDYGDSLAIDANGYAYVIGQTYSSTGLATAGAFDTSYNGSGDAFVAKVDNDMVGMVYATYLGHASDAGSNDSGEGIAVDNSSNAYVLVNLGVALYGGVDTAVVKLNAAGSGLIYSNFIGGSGNDFGTDLALDSAGKAYICGNTTSSTDFPTTNWSPYSYDAPQEAFAAQVTADGSGLVYAGFLTGSGTGSEGIAVDSGGNAYVTGTNWHGGDFPATIGPDLTANGERDAFVIKISPLLTPRAYLPLIMR